MSTQNEYTLKLINPKREPLTVVILRTFAGCEHYTDAEAQNVVESIEVLCKVAFHVREKLLNGARINNN
jgi:diadenosine tetraphosphate (Ap4A) HIT family hydrolase